MSSRASTPPYSLITDAPPSPDITEAPESLEVWYDPQGVPYRDLALVPPEFHLRSHGKILLKTEGLAGFEKKKKTSKTWDHGFEVIDIRTRKKFWLCQACHERPRKIPKLTYMYGTDSSTGRWSEHLWKCSKVDIDGKHKAPSSPASTPTLESHFPPKRPNAASMPLVGVKPLYKIIDLLIQLVVTLHIAYTIVENSTFQHLLNLLNSSYFPFIPHTAKHFKNKIMKQYRHKKAVIAEMLRHNKSHIHISFDMWTSDSTKSYLAIVGHFVDKDYNIRTILLAFRRVIGSHSGDNMASTINNVITEYEIQNKIGYFVLDNAESNDTCVEALCRDFNIQPSIPKAHRRLRCIGHIINLAAQAFLFGHDAQAFYSEIYSATAIQSEQQELDIWRKKGPIGKLHNIVKFIRRSSQRREEFLRIAVNDGSNFEGLDDLMVISDNVTRWNSAYQMIIRGLKLRNRIGLYCSQNQKPTRPPRAEDGDDGSVKNDTLTSDDWALLTEIADILKVFEEQTKNLEGRAYRGAHGTAWEVLPSIQNIIAATKKKRDYHGALCNPASEFSSPEHVVIFHSLNTCINKLEKYKALLNVSPVYMAATVMNPAYRWRWCQHNTPEDLIRKQAEVRQMWDDLYGALATSDNSRPSSSAQNHTFQSTFTDAFRLPAEPESPNDAYTEYCEDRSIRGLECEGAYDWWRQHSYLHMAEMAFDMLAIPAMSAECERIFSSASRLITAGRNKLSDEMIEVNECLRAWYQQNLAPGLTIDDEDDEESH